MLINALKSQLAAIVERHSTTTCSRWSENYVILGKPIPGAFRYAMSPWGKEWADCNEDWVGKKGAQMSMTLQCLLRSIFTIDILRNDVLYVLPKRNPDAADFSKAKFDSLLESSPYLRNLFSNVRNIGHKQSGAVNFYLRGSRSRSGLKSISVGLKVFDEFDEMNQNNVPLAEERSAGYQEKDTQTIKISTPTLPDYGISKEYAVTDQSHYYFKCPFCTTNGRPTITELLDGTQLIVLTENSEDKIALRKSYLITGCCKHPLPAEKQSYLNEYNSFWHPTIKGASLKGFWIPQFYSFVKPLWKIAQQSLRAKTDQIANQEYHNSVLAKEFVADGARVTIEMVDACKAKHHNRSLPGISKVVTLGVDVGHKELFCTIDEWLLPPEIGPNLNTAAIPITRAVFQVANFFDLDRVMYDYQILHTVIDVDPSYRDAVDFCNRFAGRANLCRFVRGLKQRTIDVEAGTNELVLQVNRTIWLDQSQSRYRFGRIHLPYNMPENYAKMLGAIIRIDEYDNDGNIVSKYKSIGADHWAFSRCYSEIALPIAISIKQGQNIANFL